MRTTLLLVRYRFHLTLPSRSGDRMAVAEDAATLGFTISDGRPVWLDDDKVAVLLQATPSGNVINAEQQITAALTRLPEFQDHLTAHGDKLAERIRASHRRVRTASRSVVQGLSVRAENPPDVLGVYVFVPVPKG